MKKIIILVFGLSVFLFACQEAVEDPIVKQEEVEKPEPPHIEIDSLQRPVLFDYTSTGCPGCGSWGKPTFGSLANEYGDKIVPVAVHIKYGDKMITDASTAIGSNRTGRYFTPQLWVNNTNITILNGNNINGAASLTSARTNLDNLINEEPKVQVGLAAVESETEYHVYYKTKLTESNTDEIYVGVYLMENGFTSFQSGAAGQSATQDYIIRASNEGGFGTLLTAEQSVVGEEFTGDYKFTIDENWNKDNLHATVIVWKKQGSNYVIMNANNNFVL